MQYAGFWKRFFSVLLDFAILLPITILILWMSFLSKTTHLILIIPHTLLYFAYHIYMNANYGGTFGKLIIGIRITKINEEADRCPFRKLQGQLPLMMRVDVTY